jgi:hypothetical protein
MKKAFVLRASLLFVGLVILAGFLVRTQSQVGPPEPLTAAERISKALVFGHRIVQVGP